MRVRVRQTIKVNKLPVCYNGKGEDGAGGLSTISLQRCLVRKQLLRCLKFQSALFPEFLIKRWSVTSDSVKRSVHLNPFISNSNRHRSHRCGGRGCEGRFPSARVH